ncbi:MAG: (2Fe-2S)-binding protein [Pseudomonadota bacterium]
MYVCICNALKENVVKDAARGDVRTVREVFRRCGTRPQCGKCVHDVAQIIAEERDAEATTVAAE